MNLLVADDEFLIRNGIVSLDWGRIGITRVLMAFNGLEAKELIRERQIFCSVILRCRG